MSYEQQSWGAISFFVILAVVIGLTMFLLLVLWKVSGIFFGHLESLNNSLGFTIKRLSPSVWLAFKIAIIGCAAFVVGGIIYIGRNIITGEEY